MTELPASWRRLSKSEERAVSRHFMHDLSFSTHRNAQGQSTIIEPTTSVTYELRPMGTYLGEEYKKRALSMCDDYLRFFRSVIASDDFVIAYDHNHPSFKFWPHEPFEYEDASDWPVTPYPDGDYHAFFASNLKSCLYGFPWQPSVCVMGVRFVEPMREWKPRAFGDRIRVGGKPHRQ